MARPRHFCGVSRELKSDEVLAINPRGQAPTFKDGDVIVKESMALMQYVEEAYPEPPLLPHAADKVKRALAYQRFHETSTLYSALGPLFIAKMTGAVNTGASSPVGVLATIIVQSISEPCACIPKPMRYRYRSPHPSTSPSCRSNTSD